MQHRPIWRNASFAGVKGFESKTQSVSRRENARKSRTRKAQHGPHSVSPFAVPCGYFEMDIEETSLKYQIRIPRVIANNPPKITTCGATTGCPPQIINTTIDRIASINSTAYERSAPASVYPNACLRHRLTAVIANAGSIQAISSTCTALVAVPFSWMLCGIPPANKAGTISLSHKK